MAVQEIVRPAETREPQQTNKLEAYSWLISWVAYGLGIGLVVVLATMGITSYQKKTRVDQLRKAWDVVYTGLKDKDKGTVEDKIATFESLWNNSEVNGSGAHPFVAMQLAQLHFELGLRPERRPSARRESLETARKIYQTVLEQKEWAYNPAYGAVACEGEALALEQLGKTDEAIEVLVKALDKYEQHFMYPMMCYQVGRLYWLRVQRDTAEGKDVSADRDKALRRLSDAVRETGKQSNYQWREEANFLMIMLEKPGKMVPEELPPQPEARKKDDEAKDEAQKDPSGKNDPSIKLDAGSAASKDPAKSKTEDPAAKAAAQGENKDAPGDKSAAEVDKQKPESKEKADAEANK